MAFPMLNAFKRLCVDQCLRPEDYLDFVIQDKYPNKRSAEQVHE